MIVNKRHIATEESLADRARLSALTMYSSPPTEQISLTEFEEFAFDRLRCECCDLFPSAMRTRRASLRRLTPIDSLPVAAGRSAQHY